MLKIRGKHEAQLPHHAAILDGDDAQLAAHLFLMADIVTDNGHPEAAGDDLLDGGNAVDLHDHAVILHGAAMAEQIPLEKVARARAARTQHHTLLRQFVQRHTGAKGERMLRRGDKAQVVCAQKDGIVALVGHDAVDDGKVQFIKPQHGINFLYRIANDLDAHVGMMAQVGGKHLRRQEVAGRGRDADGEPFDLREGILERQPRTLGNGRGAMGVFEQQGPVRRGFELAAAFDEDLDAVFLLQHADVMADGRLRQRERLRRVRIGAQLFQFEQRIDLGIEHKKTPPKTERFQKLMERAKSLI